LAVSYHFKNEIGLQKAVNQQFSVIIKNDQN